MSQFARFLPRLDNIEKDYEAGLVEYNQYTAAKTLVRLIHEGAHDHEAWAAKDNPLKMLPSHSK